LSFDRSSFRLSDKRTGQRLRGGVPAFAKATVDKMGTDWRERAGAGLSFGEHPCIVPHVNGLRFVWDENKNHANQRKHGVSFEEAQSVFSDEDAKQFFDPDHAAEEDRFILLGMSYQLRILVVCHCYREGDAVIRIISARKANRAEQQSYRS
jgi:uncharacterized DUF497 family protein